MMENNDLYGLSKDQENIHRVLSNRNRLYCVAAFAMAFVFSQNAQAQLVNNGEVKVEKNTILSVYENYENGDSGIFTNDGEVYIFRDWKNDGLVNFSTTGANAPSLGTTYFTGKDYNTKKSLVQTIDGKLRSVSNKKQSDFQNVWFENESTENPAAFYLNTQISVANKATFKKGIIEGADLGGADSDGVDFDGIMIFEKDATHVSASDLSFVDGKVQKIGDKAFEFPVGDENHFRPSYHETGVGENDAYTTQYFNKNSDNLHNHSSKEDGIQLINNAEYWNVIKNDKGSAKIVLSLSLDSKTTPSEFLNLNDNKQIVIVRWDEASGKWVNEGGVVSDRMANASPDAGYIQLLTSTVKGYGIFTMALVDKTPIDPTDLIVYNAVSPNGDGVNDTFHIKGIDKYPDNTVEIYNRWGVKVYDAQSYNETDKMFAGYSDGRATINRGEKLPTGTYFYTLKYNNGEKVLEKAGYLYINNQ